MQATPFSNNFSPDCGGSQKLTRVMNTITSMGDTAMALNIGDERLIDTSNAVVSWEVVLWIWIENVIKIDNYIRAWNWLCNAQPHQPQKGVRGMILTHVGICEVNQYVRVCAELWFNNFSLTSTYMALDSMDRWSSDAQLLSWQSSTRSCRWTRTSAMEGFDFQFPSL